MSWTKSWPPTHPLVVDNRCTAVYGAQSPLCCCRAVWAGDDASSAGRAAGAPRHKAARRHRGGAVGRVGRPGRQQHRLGAGGAGARVPHPHEQGGGGACSSQPCVHVTAHLFTATGSAERSCTRRPCPGRMRSVFDGRSSRCCCAPSSPPSCTPAAAQVESKFHELGPTMDTMELSVVLWSFAKSGHTPASIFSAAVPYILARRALPRPHLRLPSPGVTPTLGKRSIPCHRCPCCLFGDDADGDFMTQKVPYPVQATSQTLCCCRKEAGIGSSMMLRLRAGRGHWTSRASR